MVFVMMVMLRRVRTPVGAWEGRWGSSQDGDAAEGEFQFHEHIPSRVVGRNLSVVHFSFSSSQCLGPHTRVAVEGTKGGEAARRTGVTGRGGSKRGVRQSVCREGTKKCLSFLFVKGRSKAAVKTGSSDITLCV